MNPIIPRSISIFRKLEGSLEIHFFFHPLPIVPVHSVLPWMVNQIDRAGIDNPSRESRERLAIDFHARRSRGISTCWAWNFNSRNGFHRSRGTRRRILLKNQQCSNWPPFFHFYAIRIHFWGGGGVELLFFFFFFKANGSLAISVCIAKLLQKLGMNFVWGEPWRDKIEVVDREEFLMDFSFFFFFRNSNLNLFDFVLRFFFGIERLI